MADEAYLDWELEQELLLDSEQQHLSTPRQRLEDARIMADGNLSLLQEEEQDVSTHLLQRLSYVMEDEREWKCFQNINCESQQALAEINETLGSLREWKKRRKVDVPSSPSSLPLPGEGDLEVASMIAEGQLQLVSTSTPHVDHNPSSESTIIPARDGGDGSSGEDGRDNTETTCGIDERDLLLERWQGHHLRAQQVVGRLKEQLENCRPLQVSSLRPRHDGTRCTLIPPTTASTVVGEEGKGGFEKPRCESVRLRDLLAREITSLSEKSWSQASCGGGDDAELSELRRKVDGLLIRQCIESTRTEACSRAEILAQEACEDIWRDAGSAAVGGEMEVELDSFGRELDTLLRKIERSDENNDNNGDEEEQEEFNKHQHFSHPETLRAPAADGQTNRRGSSVATPVAQ